MGPYASVTPGMGFCEREDGRLSEEMGPDIALRTRKRTERAVLLWGKNVHFFVGKSSLGIEP
jgi:hypothetical protein